MTNKEIICTDALDWLAQHSSDSIFTSPPDASEIGMDPEEWKNWFRNALGLCFKSSLGPVALYVTDRLADGQTYSKSKMVLDIADDAGAKLAWHKIALRRDPMKIDLHRPTFSHLLAFNGSPGKRTPDVFPRGPVLYPNGTGLVAARTAIEWIAGQAKFVVDPFCGQGTIPAVAQALGLQSIGIDIDPAQCRKAESIKLKSISQGRAE